MVDEGRAAVRGGEGAAARRQRRPRRSTTGWSSRSRAAPSTSTRSTVASTTKTLQVLPHLEHDRRDTATPSAPSPTPVRVSEGLTHVPERPGPCQPGRGAAPRSDPGAGAPARAGRLSVGRRADAPDARAPPARGDARAARGDRRRRLRRDPRRAGRSAAPGHVPRADRGRRRPVGRRRRRAGPGREADPPPPARVRRGRGERRRRGARELGEAQGRGDRRAQGRSRTTSPRRCRRSRARRRCSAARPAGASSGARRRARSPRSARRSTSWRPRSRPTTPTNAEEEIGDVLFSVVAVARKLGVDGESALRRTIRGVRRTLRAVRRASRRSAGWTSTRCPRTRSARCSGRCDDDGARRRGDDRGARGHRGGAPSASRARPLDAGPGDGGGRRSAWSTPLILKLELMQHTGSFKPRGAFNKMLASDVPPAGVVAASGGNFGLAVAYAARELGHRAEIFVPDTSPAAKIDRIREPGRRRPGRPRVLPRGRRWWRARARRRPARSRCTRSISRRSWPAQGTIGMELAEQVPDADTVLVAVGGGGLIAGIASWFRGDVRVVGVEPEACPTLARRAARPERRSTSTVGGIAADSLGPGASATSRSPRRARWVERVVLVSDEAIRDAQRALWRDAPPGRRAGRGGGARGADRRRVPPAPRRDGSWSSCAARTPTRRRSLRRTSNGLRYAWRLMSPDPDTLARTHRVRARRWSRASAPAWSRSRGAWRT